MGWGGWGGVRAVRCGAVQCAELRCARCGAVCCDACLFAVRLLLVCFLACLLAGLLQSGLLAGSSWQISVAEAHRRSTNQGSLKLHSNVSIHAQNVTCLLPGVVLPSRTQEPAVQRLLCVQSDMHIFAMFSPRQAVRNAVASVNAVERQTR